MAVEEKFKGKKNLNAAWDKINKKFGAGTLMTLADEKPITSNLLSTGSLLIDKALGGGIGYGRLTELYGLEGSGKSTLCLQIIAEAQKAGGVCAYIDVENSMDPVYASHLGVDTSKLIFSQPTSAEEALDVVCILAETGDVNLIVLDSVAGLVPQAELDGEMGDVTVGLVARLMSKFMRKITGTLGEKNCAVVLINQIRQKISTGWSAPGAETTTTSGGNSVKFFCSQRIELRKGAGIKNGTEVIGNKTKIKITKNRIAPPMKVVEVDMIYGEGFAAGNEVVDLGIEYDLIQKSGAWFSTHDGQRLQGKESVISYYKENPQLAAELREMVKAKLNNSDTTLISNDFTETLVDGTVVDSRTGEILEQ